MNLLQIRTEARRLLAETSATASYSTDADFNAYINEGVKDMCIKGKVFEKTKSTTILTGVAAYSLPLDWLAMRTILTPLGVSLDPMEPGGFGKVFVVSGKPLYFFVTHTPLILTTRQDDTIYVAGDILTPVTANGYMYEVTVGGMSASTPPTFPTNPGTSVTDNNATLLCHELATTGYEVTLVDTPTTVGGGVGTYEIIYFALDEGLYVDTDAPNFPEDKHHLLVLFAMFRHFVKCKDVVRAQGVYADYAAGLGLQAPGQGGA